MAKAAHKGQNYPPNDLERREGTRKSKACQRCGKKVQLGNQFRVQIKGGDRSPGKLRVEKSKGAIEDKSHYCGDCAETRKSELQRQVNAELGGGRKPQAKAKPKAKAKSKAKPKAKPKAKAKTAPKPKAKKRTAKRSTAKQSKAVASEEPF